MYNLMDINNIESMRPSHIDTQKDPRQFRARFEQLNQTMDYIEEVNKADFLKQELQEERELDLVVGF